jgi:hypothetical protein
MKQKRGLTTDDSRSLITIRRAIFVDGACNNRSRGSSRQWPLRFGISYPIKQSSELQTTQSFRLGLLIPVLWHNKPGGLFQISSPHLSASTGPEICRGTKRNDIPIPIRAKPSAFAPVFSSPSSRQMKNGPPNSNAWWECGKGDKGNRATAVGTEPATNPSLSVIHPPSRQRTSWKLGEKHLNPEQKRPSDMVGCEHRGSFGYQPW